MDEEVQKTDEGMDTEEETAAAPAEGGAMEGEAAPASEGDDTEEAA